MRAKIESIEVNLNKKCFVKLTANGARILSVQCPSYNYKAGKFWVGPLWEAMRIFGPYIGMDCEPPFQDNNITIEN